LRSRWRPLAVPLVTANTYYLYLAMTIGIFVVVCAGLNVLAGYAGQISLGHAGPLRDRRLHGGARGHAAGARRVDGAAAGGGRDGGGRRRASRWPRCVCPDRTWRW
jgi:hypothetical protein